MFLKMNWLAFALCVALIFSVCERHSKKVERVSKLEEALAIYVTTNEGGYAIGEKIRMRLIVRNRLDRPVRLEFPTNQKFDFIILKGRIPVWRWSEGKHFAQAATFEVIPPRDSLVYEAEWTQEDPQGKALGLGKYTLQGIIMTKPELRSRPVTFGIVD